MSNSIFKEIHNEFRDAKQSCIILNLDIEYPQEIWKNRQLTFLEEAKSCKAPRPEILSRYLKDSGIKTVFDYGGGSGWTLILMDTLGFNLEEKVVIETNDSISWFKHLSPGIRWLDQNEASLVSKIPEEAIFYSNSCVQYLENYQLTLDPFMELKWEYVIFEDLPTWPTQDVWTLQQYYGYSTPYHFFILDAFTNFVESHGYELIFTEDYKDTFPENWKYQILDQEAKFKPNTPVSLVFKRKT